MDMLSWNKSKTTTITSKKWVQSMELVIIITKNGKTLFETGKGIKIRINYNIKIWRERCSGREIGIMGVSKSGSDGESTSDGNDKKGS